jgi:conjugative relaxase-like TrwC/TraI family protein
MLSIAPLTNGNYHQYLAGSYYSGEQQAGEWFGTGAERLGLKGRVTAKHFRRLFDGFDKDNKKLVQNAGKKPDPVTKKGGRQPGWDLTFSAPKDVSVLWAVSDPETRLKIEAAHRQAVRDALAYLEREAGQVRTQKGGKTVERAGLVAATFQHATSRELDPQLHTHCVVMNVGVPLADDKTRALKSDPLYEHKMSAGARYRKTLAEALVRTLGLVLVAEQHGFRIDGVPEELVREISKRWEQIEAKLAAWGTNTPAAASAAAAVTRKSKEHHPTAE